jgi:hypothetical protein
VRVMTASILAAAMFLIAACSSQSQSPAQVVQTKCTTCHNADRIKAADHDLAGWKAIIARMVDNGARLTPVEADAMARFLAAGGAAKL